MCQRTCMFSPLFWLADCMNFHIAVDSGCGCCHSFRGIAISDAMFLGWSRGMVVSEAALFSKVDALSMILLTRQLVGGDAARMYISASWKASKIGHGKTRWYLQEMKD
jgi:hypothetical protein